MTSQILGLLYFFNGRNFPDWEATTRHVVNATSCHLALSTQPLLILVNGVETDESRKTWTFWEDQDTQAYDNLMLHISADIRKLAVKAKMGNTRELLDWLKMQYDTTSISAAYADIVTINKLQIPGDCDPTPSLNRLLTLFTHLEDNKLVYPEPIRAITLLLKLPPQIEEIACSYNQKTKDTTSLTFATICNDTILN